MADDDKQDISLWDKILTSIESVIDLRVITYVGDVEISGSLNKPEIDFPTDKQAKALATSISLSQGDITSAVPEEFLAPDQEVIREYHKAQVAQANLIVERNVSLLIELVKNVASELKGIPARSNASASASAEGNALQTTKLQSRADVDMTDTDTGDAPSGGGDPDSDDLS